MLKKVQILMLNTPEIDQILQHFSQAGQVTAQEQAQLEQAWQAQPEWANALGIDVTHTADFVTKQLRFWPLALAAVKKTFLGGEQGEWLRLLWHLWLPLSLKLIRDCQDQTHPLIQGIVGAQGAGKTTLAKILQLLLTELGYPTLSLSIDDFYLTYAERQQLQQKDPRLIWRGPPGTHDLQLAITVLEQLRQGQPTAVPRFDKTAHNGAGDRQGLERVAPAEIVLFEGWFVGARPLGILPPFAAAPTPICTAADYQFAQDMNQSLQGYLPLWTKLDRLIVLDLVDYQLSYQWRNQAEQENLAQGKAGMSAVEVEEFVTYFWQALHPAWFIKPLIQSSQSQPPVDLVIEILANHQPGRVYMP